MSQMSEFAVIMPLTWGNVNVRDARHVGALPHCRVIVCSYV